MRGVQRLVFKVLWFLQASGLTSLAKWLGRRRLLPGRLSDLASQSPPFPFESFRGRHAAKLDRSDGVLRFSARGKSRKRVAFFTGCLSDQLLADVNHATVQVLNENGCDVEIVRDERCCGALHVHNGARDGAAMLARDNVRCFGARGYDAIVSSAAGCGAELRRYGELLDGEANAEAFAARVRDISEFLCELGIKTPSSFAGTVSTVAYDEPCHLLHAQKISDPPKQLLAAIPGLKVVALDEADVCCGGAGIYWLTQPDLARKITARKLDAIRRSGSDIVATGNPGCLLQIRSAARSAGLNVRVAHPVQLLAEAYSNDPKRPMGSHHGR
jgi:glycolate oxidase iron-sulfur subunit